MAVLRRVEMACFLLLVVVTFTSAANIQPRDNNFPGLLKRKEFVIAQNQNENIAPVNREARVPESHEVRANQIPPGARKSGPSLIRIAESEECRGDVKAFCGSSIAGNNFAVLDCLQNDLKAEDEITSRCQHFLWTYKLNLTQDMRFESASWEVCKPALNGLSECSKLDAGQGEIIPCLIEHKENITQPNCKQFLTKMESIIFSDYRLVKNLLSKCRSDITKTHCGRIGPDTQAETDQSEHSHGKTIGCLEENLTSLDGSCRFEMMRIAELQADDYHLDRPLYYACREDRERFCQETRAGGGRIFDCLFKHKFQRDMTDECRNRLVIRQKLIGSNYKADKTFYESCKQDVERYKCLAGNPPHEFAQRSAIILCIENAIKTDHPVEGRCVAEINEWRRSLMADYQISPNLVTACATEISVHCGDLRGEGKTIHCLMQKAQPDHHLDGQQHVKQPRLGPQCMRALEELMKEADVGEDFRLDQSLQDACQEAADKFCHDIKPGDARVMGCLMEKLEPEIQDSEYAECAEHLLEIQYFVARDFRLEPRVFRYCHKDAKKWCGASEQWNGDGTTDVDPGPLVLPCLYRQIVHHDRVDKNCRREVNRVMRMRASNIDLLPEVEKDCLLDLGRYCSEHTAKGEEIQCLQDKYEKLDELCQEVIANFTEAEDDDINLDAILMRACMPMIKKFCEDSLDDGEEEEIMECLIENKNDKDMNKKCYAGIHHHQLVNLKDFKFNHKFKENCKQAVTTLCKGKRTKNDVLTCLSEHVRNDTLLDEKQRIDKACRRQLRVELLQRAESIDLDPDLEKACKEDRKQFCSNVTPGKAQVLECLRRHQRELSRQCRKFMLKREEVEVKRGGDYTVMSVCKKMIKHYCGKTEPEGILDCLKIHKNEEDFDEKCRKLVVDRQVVQNLDYRLNPQLQKSCEKDIPKFCKDIINHEKEDEFLEGKMINCLKKQYKINRLSHGCEHYVREIIKDAALDYRQDPVLAAACKHEITKYCSDALVGSANKINEALPSDEKGGVEECLKKNLKNIKTKLCWKEVSRILSEGKADVHVDPLLHTACMSDLNKYCPDVHPGEGRMMSCLLSTLEDNRRLHPTCRDMLIGRKDMWEFAAKVAPPESLQEVYEGMTASPHRNYLFGILVTVVGVIFIMGLSCGRVTKRVRADLKNK